MSLNDYHTAFLAKAVELYDSRRAMGIPEGRALYLTAAGLATALNVTREKARAILEPALRDRAEVPTRSGGLL